MAHGQGATSNRRGGYGAFDRGTRGHGKDKSVKKAETRARDQRWQDAMNETRKRQEELDALIAEQAEKPAVGVTAGALYREKLAKVQADLAAAQAMEAKVESEVESEAVVEIKPVKFSVRRLRKTGEPNFEYAGMTARMMVRAGYHVEHAMEFTGVGYEDLEDLVLDEDGFGMTKERIAAEEAEDENSSSAV